jgi:hypothetical protein
MYDEYLKKQHTKNNVVMRQRVLIHSKLEKKVIAFTMT